MKEEANLGLATCRELLEELKTRGEIHYDQLNCASVFNFYLTSLPEEFLNYRTIDS